MTINPASSTATRPAKRIFLSAEWRWLALLNYKIDPALLAPLVPRGVELDTYGTGETYISLVGFLFQQTRLLGWAIPAHRNFEELNLRFYVQRRVDDEVRRGVVFVKELVPRVAVTTIAKAWYNENYQTVPMRHAVTPGDVGRKLAPQAKYEFRHAGEWNSIRVSTHDEPQIPLLGSHEAFVLEHYYGYCRQRDGGTIEYRVDHPRWTVWPGAECEVDCDFTALYGPALGAALSRKPDTVFMADGSAVTVEKPVRIC